MCEIGKISLKKGPSSKVTAAEKKLWASGRDKKTSRN